MRVLSILLGLCSRRRNLFKTGIALTGFVLLSACDTGVPSDSFTPAGGVFLEEVVSTQGGGQILGRNQVSLGIAAGTDRTDTILHTVKVRLDPNLLNIRQLRPDDILIVEVATSLTIMNDVTGDILVTRNLPRRVNQSDTIQLVVAAANNWEASETLRYRNVPLARTLNVFGLQGTMLTRSIDSTANIVSIKKYRG